MATERKPRFARPRPIPWRVVYCIEFVSMSTTRTLAMVRMLSTAVRATSTLPAVQKSCDSFNQNELRSYQNHTNSAVYTVLTAANTRTCRPRSNSDHAVEAVSASQSRPLSP
eukprot:3528582-Prymnesium_polylepis.1